MIWRIAKLCSVVLRPAVKPACSLRRWLWKVGLMCSKRIIANSFPGMESRVMLRWFEHTSLFPLFFQKGRMIPLRQSSGMVFLIHRAYNVDYVRQPLNHWVPAFLEQYCGDGADARGSSIFEVLETDVYFMACDWVSGWVRIRCCLVIITLEFGVCCITWLVKQIIEVIFLFTQAVFDIGQSCSVFSLDGITNV